MAENTEANRLRAQRDRAWLALMAVEGLVSDGETDPMLLGIHLAAGHGLRDVEEWNDLCRKVEAKQCD